MNYNVIASEIAIIDIDDAAEFYNFKKHNLGRTFLLSLQDIFKMLAINPFMFVSVHNETKRAVISKFPYAIFYIIDEKNKEVEIFTVLSKV